MNLEHINQSKGNRLNRQQKAVFAQECASALVNLDIDSHHILIVASRQSHILAQKNSAPRMERENSGFSR